MSFTAFLKIKTTKYVDFRMIGFLDAGSIPATSTKKANSLTLKNITGQIGHLPKYGAIKSSGG